MRAFRLKSTVSFDTRCALPQLVDAVTGRTFPLSATEASVVRCLGSGCTSQELLERLQARGVPLERRQLTVFVNRLTAAGFLETEGVPTPRPVPPVLGLADAVPRLRSDLVFKPAARAGLVEVRDLRAGRSFTLFEFEVTIARMLDGQQTLDAVMGAIERLGIEVTHQTLRNFIHQLDGLGFLEPSPESIVRTAASPQPTPPAAQAPANWLPELREMFNFALRHARAHQYEQALEYLEGLLEIDPTLPEAKALFDDVKARREGAGGLDFQTLHGAPPPPPPIPPVVTPPVAGASVATKDAKPPPAQPPDSTVHPVSESLPPLWTVSTVMKAMPELPDVGDSVLAFDPSRRDAPRAAPPARPKDKVGRK
ncbi:MAG: hypothetical protein AB1730_06630 [Myxococcota bacterium]